MVSRPPLRRNRRHRKDPSGSAYCRLLDANSNTLLPTKLTLMERFSSPHRQLRAPITSSHSSVGPNS